jgi:hypothetical protein
VPHERVDEALRFLEEIDPQPANRWGTARLWLRAECTFRVRDPDTGTALPGQDSDRYGGFEYEWRVALGTSRLALNLSNRASLAIDLCLPDADDDTLARVVPWFHPNLLQVVGQALEALDTDEDRILQSHQDRGARHPITRAARGRQLRSTAL